MNNEYMKVFNLGHYVFVFASLHFFHRLINEFRFLSFLFGVNYI